MEGGGFWRDVATHYDNNTKKTYAYVGAQGTQGGGKNPNLFVFDLSHLSGEINNAHGVDTNPIPSGPSGYLSESNHSSIACLIYRNGFLASFSLYSKLITMIQYAQTWVKRDILIP